MAKTEVILTSNIVGLGAESDQVKVAAGYARNYLLPQGLAIPLSASNKKRLEVLRQRRAEREAHELNTMTELAASISKIVLKITVKTGADGKMFGAVTSGTISDELKQQCEVTLEKRKIHLEQPLHTLGEHEVELHLHSDVNARLKVRIESATPSDASLLGPAASEPMSRDARSPRSPKGAPREKKDAAPEKPVPAKEAKSPKAKSA